MRKSTQETWGRENDCVFECTEEMRLNISPHLSDEPCSKNTQMEQFLNATPGKCFTKDDKVRFRRNHHQLEDIRPFFVHFVKKRILAQPRKKVPQSIRSLWDLPLPRHFR